MAEGDPAPEQIGIVLVDMPQMLREIVKSVIGSETDMVVLGEYPRSADLASAIGRTGAEFIVTDVETARCDDVFRLLAERPDLRVLGIADDGLEGVLHEVKLRRVSLGEVSPQSLVDAIRNPHRASTAP